jgi:hypothetical protein
LWNSGLYLGTMAPMRCLLKSILITLLLSSFFAAAQDVTLQPVTSGNFRFKDIGGEAFSAAFQTSFSYANSSVVVTIDDSTDLYLSGRIKATGLKPNFAYQIKLSAQSSKAAQTPDEAAFFDDVTNERLGRAGRWWRFSPNPANATDAEFDADKDKDGFIYGGYLIIGFFTTDTLGNADVAFVGNNSYHVLWRTNQRLPSINDGPVLNVTLPDTTGNAAYDTVVAARDFGLYGEHEGTRALPGKLAMPLGHYKCMINLTEESFHDGGPIGGTWATAMSSRVEFDIPTVNNPSIASPLSIEKVRASMQASEGGRDSATLTGTLQLPPEVVLDGQEVRVNVLGVSRTLVLNRMGIGNSSDAQIMLRRDRKNPGTVRFTLRLRRAAFVLGQINGAGPLPFSVDLSAIFAGETFAGTASTELRVRGGRISVKK